MRRFPGLVRVSVLFLLLLSPAACSDGPATLPTATPPEALVVRLSPRSDTVAVGASRTYTATVTTASGAVRSAPIDWSTTDPSVASVQNGQVTAVTAGAARIIARVGASADTAALLVYNPLLELRINPSAVAASLGDTIAFEATLVGPNGHATRTTARWTVSDSASAHIVSDGVIETRSTGDVMVTAAVAGGEASAQMRIVQPSVSSITITPSNLSMVVGERARLTATALDYKGRPINGMAITWSVTNPAIATVSTEGMVSAVARGGTTVTARSGGKAATATVNVAAAPSVSVTLTLPNDSVATGQTMQAQASNYDANGQPLSGRPMAWQSSNPAVATINNAGTIVALVPGQTTISVISDGNTDSERLTVVAARPTTMAVLPGALSLSVASTGRLVAEIRDQFGQAMQGLVTTWSSNASTVASVDQGGLVTGVAIGTATVKASYQTFSATATVTVGTVPVASITLSHTTAILSVGGTTVITATPRDANGQPLLNRPVTWTSSKPAVATVSAAGLVTAVSAGSAIVTASSGGASSTATITVLPASPPPVALVTLSLTASQVVVGQTTQATARAYDANGTEIFGRTVTYSSAQPSIASVSSSGLVTAVGGGTTAISATIDGVAGFGSLTVSGGAPAPVATVTILASPTQFPVGDSSQTNVILRDAQGNILTRTISYTSNRPTVAGVNTGGMVRGLTYGDALVGATSEGQTGTLLFEIDSSSAGQAPVATVTVTLNSQTITTGQGTQAAATLTDAQGNVLTGRTITWSSSNPSVATVAQNGYVTAVASGTASITALSEGKTGAASVTVQAPSNLPVATVQVTLLTSGVPVGSSTSATATARDAQGGVVTGKPVTWSVGNPAVASIASSTAPQVAVTGIAAGTSTVTAVVDGVTGSTTLTVQAPAPPSPVTPPAPPQILNFTYPQVTGQTWIVKPTDNLQTILNNAQRGDEVVLPAGSTFTGNFSLPAKTGTPANGWIIIRSDKANLLPQQGTRVTPAHAALMPKLVTNNVSPVLSTALSASGWWVSGIEMTVDPALTAVQYGIVRLGDGSSKQNSLSVVATDLVMDRVYIHGQTTTNTSRCLELNSARSAIMDSYLMDCHGKGFDSQAIVGWNGPGPFKIVNNTLAGAGENIMFGGADPAIRNLIPSDIEIRRNYVYTPASWKNVWTKKNLFETKNAQRILIEENVFDGSWADGQVGYAFLLKSANQSGSCTWCESSDIMIRRNIIRNSGAGFNLTGREGSNPNPVGALLNNVAIEDNVVENINVGVYTGEAKLFLISLNLQNLSIRRNTMTGNGLASFIDITQSPAATGFVYEENIASYGAYGLFNTTFGVGEVALQAVKGTVSFKNVVLIGSQKTGYPNASFVPDLASALATGRGANPATLAAITQGVVIP